MLKYSIIRSQSRLPRIISIVRKHHLYITGWLMSDWMKDRPNILQVILCKDDDKPVAVGMLHHGWSSAPNAGIYVKPRHRKQGIGSHILKLLSKSHIPLSVAYGNQASHSFYRRHKKKFELSIKY